MMWELFPNMLWTVSEGNRRTNLVKSHPLWDFDICEGILKVKTCKMRSPTDHNSSSKRGASVKT